MIINREEYLHELTKDMGRKDLLKPDEVENIKKCLDIALDLRKFEIELYWKRTTYFWGINAAVLAFYGVILTSKRDVDPFLLIIIPAFGMIVSTCLYYLNRGGKFWQENWEMHVNYLSLCVNGNLFRMIPMGNRDHFSVSKINNFFSMAIFYLWIFIFTDSLIKFIDIEYYECFTLNFGVVLCIFGIILIVTTVIMYLFESRIRSDKNSYDRFDDKSH